MPKWLRRPSATERDALVGMLDGYQVMAERSGRAADPGLVDAQARARAAVRAIPCDLDQARRLVAEYQGRVRS